MSSAQLLSGRGVVITRPARESQRLAELIREAGGVPLLYPGMDILDAPDSAALDAVIDRLHEFDLAIFISPTAVQQAMPRILEKRALPLPLRCAAIGPGGVRALQQFGVREVIAPDPGSARHDSESLLATSFLQNVSGMRVVIFRGDGGRELLRDALVARGASVQTVACYRRAAPSWDGSPLLQAWARGEVAAVIVTSSEGLRQFCTRLGVAGTDRLRDTPLIVPHLRIAAAARAMGMNCVEESVTGDAALLAAVIRRVNS